MGIADWLRQLGLERYEPVFRDHEIDWEVLPELTEGDLEKLGLPLGPRKKLLKAIAGLTGTPTAVLTEPAPHLRPVPPEAERRQLTVMFVDLVGSTALSRRLDPEDMSAVIRAYQGTVAGEITRFEGHVAKFMGDGVLAYFGWPQAHEDEAERAVRTGLAIVEAVPRLSSPKATELAARVGIATGLVVVGDLVGNEEARERTVIGETPNLAARLQSLAAPGAVVIAAATRRLLGTLFACEDLGAQQIKGFDVPVPAWQVRGECEPTGRFQALRGARLTRLVGREDELALLFGCWQRAKASEGQIVLLSGEPGIGKSRLAQELKERAARDGDTQIELRCSAHYQNTPLYPIIEHLQRMAGFARHDSPEGKLAKLEQILSSEHEVDTVPLLAALLSLPHPAGHPRITLSPQRQKERTQEALVAWLTGEAARGALCCVWEDLHWADPSTQEILPRLFDQVPTCRILLLLTFRPEFAPATALPSSAAHLTLGRLGGTHVGAMVEGVTGGRTLPTEVARQIVAKTDGVPLFVEELTKAVVELGLLREVNGHYELRGPLSPFAIPSTLHDSLMARLDRLAPAREVAQLGATLGREFSYELIRIVSPLDETALRTALARLVDADLIHQQGLPPEAWYSFKHALVQDTAYESLLKSTRQRLHQQIAQVLEEQFPETAESQPELLARHYTGAGLAEPAIRYWQRAGQRATQRSANLEAISHFGNGLELLKTLPDTSERLERELRLQVDLSAPLMAAKGWAAPEVERASARARELCELVGASAPLFPVLWGLWNFYIVRGRLQAAQDLGGQCMRLAEQIQDPVLLLHANYIVGDTHFWQGDIVAARAHLEQDLALADLQGRRPHALAYGLDPGVACLSHAAWALWLLGYPDQGLERARQACSIARELTHPISSAWALWCAAILHRHRREERAVQEQVEALIALSTDQEFPHWLLLGATLRGWALSKQGCGEGEIDRMRDGLATWRAMGAELDIPHGLSLLAEACAATGRFEEGLSAVMEALGVVERTGERMWEAELYRLRGELHREVGAADRAEADFQQSLALARGRGIKTIELRTATGLAGLWAKHGRQGDAHALLAPAYGRFTEGFDTVDLREAKALLDGLQ